MLGGLAFLSLEHVFEGMTYFKTKGPSEGGDVLNYFETTYVPFIKVGTGTKFKFL